MLVRLLEIADIVSGHSLSTPLVEELPDGSTLDLQPDRLWRASLLSKLDEQAAVLLRTLKRTRLIIDTSLVSHANVSIVLSFTLKIIMGQVKLQKDQY